MNIRSDIRFNVLNDQTNYTITNYIMKGIYNTPFDQQKLKCLSKYMYIFRVFCRLHVEEL